MASKDVAPAGNTNWYSVLYERSSSVVPHGSMSPPVMGRSRPSGTAIIETRVITFGLTGISGAVALYAVLFVPNCCLLTM